LFVFRAIFENFFLYGISEKLPEVKLESVKLEVFEAMEEDSGEMAGGVKSILCCVFNIFLT
jgi:hypothetical protein